MKQHLEHIHAFDKVEHVELVFCSGTGFDTQEVSFILFDNKVTVRSDCFKWGSDVTIVYTLSSLPKVVRFDQTEIKIEIDNVIIFELGSKSGLEVSN